MLTPLDIENKKFSKQMMNGYSVEEVDDFLDELTVDYEKIYKEVAEAKNKIEDLQESMEKYKNINIYNDDDRTKIFISSKELGMAGYELDEMLRMNYNVQVELSKYY